MLSGLKNIGDIAKFMKNAQEAKQQIAGVQKELLDMFVAGSSCDGLITVTCNGIGTIRSLKIDPNIHDQNSPYELQDLVLEAVQKAQAQASHVSKERMERVAQQYGLPSDTNWQF